MFHDWVGKNGKVVAFEPEPFTFQTLSKLFEADKHKNVFLMPKALSEKSGVAYFSVESENHITVHLVDIENSNTVSVETITVDQIVVENNNLVPNVVKINVEGFEEDVLKGGTKAFSNSKCKHILVEMHFTRMDERKLRDSPNRIVKMLKSWGYKVNWVDSSHIHAKR